MKFYNLIILVLASTTSAFAQFSVHSIDFRAPICGHLTQHNTINLGVTLKMPETSKLLEISLLSFADNGRKHSTGLGSYNTISYFNNESNAFIINDRPIYNLQYGDTILTQYQSISRDALGLNIGLRTDYSFGNIPFYTSLSASIIGTRTTYKRSESYEVFDSASTNLGYKNFGSFETSSPHSNFSYEQKFSFVPQLNAQIGPILSFNERIKIIPKVSANVTYPEYFTYNIQGATSSYRSLDIKAAASFQLFYVIK